ncbi:MAG: START-like superfamily domain, partial [Bacteroidota bacterium]
RIKISDISRDTILIVTDFAEPNEIKDVTLLWDSTVKILKQHIGG